MIGRGKPVTPWAMRKAFSLFELLVVIGIVSILMGLFLPAVQRVRESARNVSCLNNLRQIGIAVHGFESARRHLPGSWFNAAMDTPEYHQDRGLFVQLLPWVDETGLHSGMLNAPTTFSQHNNERLSAAVNVYSCPSNSPPVTLTSIAEKFSTAAVSGLTSLTCDYIGNGGYVPESNPADMATRKTEGPIGVQIPGTEAVRVSSPMVSDGLSNTLLFWESAGGLLVFPGANLEVPVNENAPDSFVLLLDGSTGFSFPSDGSGSSKSYLYSWAGLRIGVVAEYGNGVVNIMNINGDPYSRHPASCNVAMVGGSVRTISDGVDPELFFSISSAAGGEVTPPLE